MDTEDKKTLQEVASELVHEVNSDTVDPSEMDSTLDSIGKITKDIIDNSEVMSTEIELVANKEEDVDNIIIDGDFETPLTEEDILTLVKRDIDAASKYHDTFAEKFLECYKDYHAVIDPKYNTEGRSTLSSTDVADTIEWMLPSFMRIFASAEDIVVIDPIGEEDVKSAELHQALLNYQFSYKLDGFTKFYTWFKDALIYGIGIVKVYWDNVYSKKVFYYKELTQEQFDKFSLDPNVSIEAFDEFETVEITATENEEVHSEPKRVYKNVKLFVKKLSYAGPQVENIPPTSFYIEPGAKSIKEANFVAHRVRRTMDYLRRMERDGIYHNVSKVLYNVPSEVDSENQKYLEIESQSEYTNTDELLGSDINGREPVWVWECYVKLDIDGDGLLEPLLVTVCNDTILRVTENPFDHGEPPFEILAPILDTHKFYGISITSIVSEFQRMKTALLRNIFDNIAFGVNNYFLVNRDAGVDVGALQNLKPGSVIYTEDVSNSVREMQPGQLPNYIFNLLEYCDSMRENRTSITKYNQGSSSASLNHTATGISTIMNASQQRLELIARLFAETGVKGLFRKMISLNQQFIKQAFVIRLFNKSLSITPDALDGSFDIKVTVGVGAGLQDIKIQQYMQILNILPSLSQVGLVTPEHVYNLVSNLYKAMGIKDINTYIQKPVAQQAQPTPQIPQPPDVSKNPPEMLPTGQPIVNPQNNQ